jgi:hypothetical protein
MKASSTKPASQRGEGRVSVGDPVEVHCGDVERRLDDHLIAGAPPDG